MFLIPGIRRISLLLAGVLTLSPLGCGDGKPENVSISGKVVYANGKPLTAGTIVFNPLNEDEGAPLAEIQEDGTFEFSSENGVPPGEYRVSLATPEGEDDPVEAESEEAGTEEEGPEASSFPVPEKYLDAETSGWKTTVKESGNEPLTFTIK